MNMTGRQTEIIALVRQNGFMSVDQLSEQFAVTPQTIRRDVNTLCDANLLRRAATAASKTSIRRSTPPMTPAA